MVPPYLYEKFDSASSRWKFEDYTLQLPYISIYMKKPEPMPSMKIPPFNPIRTRAYILRFLTCFMMRASKYGRHIIRLRASNLFSLNILYICTCLLDQNK